MFHRKKSNVAFSNLHFEIFAPSAPSSSLVMNAILPSAGRNLTLPRHEASQVLGRGVAIDVERSFLSYCLDFDRSLSIRIAMEANLNECRGKVT